MKNKLCDFTSPGLVGIVMLKEKASSMFKIVFEDHKDDDDDDDDEDVSLQCIANRIKEEIKKMAKRKTEYNTTNTENLFDECSNTLIAFLSQRFFIALKKASLTQ